MSEQKIRAAAYARCSLVLNQNPENQLVHIRKYIELHNMQLVEEYVDHGVSGTKERRPALDRLTRDAASKKFTVIVVAGVDRVARNTRHLLNLFHQLTEFGVALISLRENVDFRSPVGQATLSILGAISSLERELISERIRSALAAKKATAQSTGNGWRCGRPTVLNQELRDKILALRNQGLSIRRIEEQLSRVASRTTIGRILREAQASNATVTKP